MECCTAYKAIALKCIFATSVLGIFPHQVSAQEAEESGMILEEVTVTAQKREESIQDIPISVAAFTGEMVEQMGGTNITNINGIAPNIVMLTEGLVPNIPMFSIRGMSHQDPDPNSDPKPA